MNNSLSREKQKLKIKRYLFVLSIIILPLINFIVFYLVQNFSSFIMAFQVKKQGISYWSFDNYVRIFREFTQSDRSSDLYISLINTFKFFFLGIIMLPVSFLTSYFMYKKIFLHGVFKIVFFLPSILSAVVWSSIFKLVLEPTGPIARFIQ